LGFLARVFEPEPAGTLAKDNRHRLERVMRLREGDSFVITDGKGREARAVLKGQGAYELEEWQNPGREASIDLTLYAALTKGEKFDWLVEKAVELGVKTIVPVISQHCVVKKTSENKVERWQKIAISAMLQCGGCVLPEVTAPVKIEKLPQHGSDVPGLILYEQKLAASKTGFADFAMAGKISVLTGPEGGFSPEEIDALREKGWQTVWLGKRIFRAETAPLIALANLLSQSWGIHS
jgi:16S rRNA (uracil1498-N3)-methyltransferase